MAVATTGEFFIADGYCNSRIMKFNSDGTYKEQFGGKNNIFGWVLLSYIIIVAKLVEDFLNITIYCNLLSRS